MILKESEAFQGSFCPAFFKKLAGPGRARRGAGAEHKRKEKKGEKKVDKAAGAWYDIQAAPKRERLPKSKRRKKSKKGLTRSMRYGRVYKLLKKSGAQAEKL